MRSGEEDSQGPVIRDRRRIDPVTGQVRDPVGQSGHGQGYDQGDASEYGPARPRGRHAVPKPGGPAGAGGSAAGNAGNPPGTGGPPPGPQVPSQPSAEQGRADQAGASQGGASQGSASQGSASQGSASQGGAGNGLTAEAEQLAAKLAERTADLQRLQAEYANYRKRVERDRLVVREQALANVLTELLPVLDDIGRAREHGELTGGFKSVAESLESAAVKLGLGTYGEDGDPFDPRLHEALMHSYSPDVTETTCVRILQPGYKVGDRILRPARVAVAEPAGPQVPGDEHDDLYEGAGEDDYAGSAGHADGEPPGGFDGTD